MDKINEIKTKLEEKIYSEVCKGLEYVDTEELYKAIDMLKDMAEASYYCTLTEAMEENSEEYGKTWDENGKKFYSRKPRRMTAEMYRDMDWDSGRMYYTENDDNMNGNKAPNDLSMDNSNSRYYGGDSRMGRSGYSRKRYYESKAMGDNTAKMQSLEEYARTLSDDVTEMIQGASENEKQMLRTKLQVLMQKI